MVDTALLLYAGRGLICGCRSLVLWYKQIERNATLRHLSLTGKNDVVIFTKQRSLSHISDQMVNYFLLLYTESYIYIYCTRLWVYDRHALHTSN